MIVQSDLERVVVYWYPRAPGRIVSLCFVAKSSVTPNC